VNELLSSDLPYTVYNPQSFKDLKVLFDQVELIWNGKKIEIPKTIQVFLGKDWRKQFDKVRSQTASFDTFTNRFFKWFDAFKILKYVHFSRDHFYPNIGLHQAIQWLGEKQEMDLITPSKTSIQSLRDFDRNFTPDQTSSSHQ